MTNHSGEFRVCRQGVLRVTCLAIQSAYITHIPREGRDGTPIAPPTTPNALNRTMGISADLVLKSRITKCCLP